MNIDPIETRWASAYTSGPAPFNTPHDVTIIVEEPLAHLRREFEAHDVQLNQFAYPSYFLESTDAITSRSDH